MDDAVLIVGAGPVGLSLGLALALQGRPVRIFDARPGVPPDLRATTVQPAVLEMFLSWGVLHPMLKLGQRVDHLQYWDHVDHRLLAELDYALIAEDTTCPFRLHLEQGEICAVILATLERLQPDAVSWSTRAVRFEDHADGVSLEVVGPDGRLATHRGEVLCGADGTHSTIRRQLGIEMEVVGPPERFHACMAPPTAVHELDRLAGQGVAPVSYLYLERDWAMVMVMRDAVRLLFRRRLDQDGAPNHAELEELTREVFGPDAPRMKGLALYEVRPQLAATLRRGSVVLLGDSAHSAYPVNGTAMNAGIYDAWELATALEGGTRALDRYSDSRRAWLQEHLLSPAVASMQAMGADGLWSRRKRTRWIHQVAASDEAKRAHLLQLSMLSPAAPVPD